jgi:DNA-binding NarL/FixJ family response regulator
MPQALATANIEAASLPPHRESRPDGRLPESFGDQTVASVLIGDAHAPARAGVRRALAGHRFTIVGEAGDVDAVVAIALRTRPDLCVMDVLLPGDGVRAARVLSSRLPATAVVVLTASKSEDDFFDALRAGVAGYLLKDLDPARLPHALEGVLAGESAVPRRLVPRLMEEFRGQSRRRVPLKHRRGPELTARQWEVLELLRGGLTTAGIASRLFLSPVTVRRHLSGITKKLEVGDRDEALRLLDETA